MRGIVLAMSVSITRHTVFGNRQFPKNAFFTHVYFVKSDKQRNQSAPFCPRMP